MLAAGLVCRSEGVDALGQPVGNLSAKKAVEDPPQRGWAELQFSRASRRRRAPTAVRLLQAAAPRRGFFGSARAAEQKDENLGMGNRPSARTADAGALLGQRSRSEERRVGKECRSRW